MPATEVPATAPAATAAPAEGSTTISPWWWLLVAAIVVAAGAATVLILRHRGAQNAWNGELQTTITELRWVEDQLIPGMLAAPTAAEFTQAWTDGRPRLVAADQQLFVLAGRTSDWQKSASLSRLRTAISSLMHAVDAEARSTSTDPAALRAARAEVERARSQFSAMLDEAAGTPQPTGPKAA